MNSYNSICIYNTIFNLFLWFWFEWKNCVEIVISLLGKMMWRTGFQWVQNSALKIFSFFHLDIIFVQRVSFWHIFIFIFILFIDIFGGKSFKRERWGLKAIGLIWACRASRVSLDVRFKLNTIAKPIGNRNTNTNYTNRKSQYKYKLHVTTALY